MTGIVEQEVSEELLEVLAGLENWVASSESEDLLLVLLPFYELDVEMLE